MQRRDPSSPFHRRRWRRDLLPIWVNTLQSYNIQYSIPMLLFGAVYKMFNTVAREE